MILIWFAIQNAFIVLTRTDYSLMCLSLQRKSLKIIWHCHHLFACYYYLHCSQLWKKNRKRMSGKSKKKSIPQLAFECSFSLLKKKIRRNRWNFHFVNGVSSHRLDWCTHAKTIDFFASLFRMDRDASSICSFVCPCTFVESHHLYSCCRTRFILSNKQPATMLHFFHL